MAPCSSETASFFSDHWSYWRKLKAEADDLFQHILRWDEIERRCTMKRRMMNVNWGFCVTQPLLWDSMGSPSYGSLWEAPQVSECIVWGYDKPLCNKCSIYSFQIHPSIHPSIYSAACLTIHPSIHPFGSCLSIAPSIHPSIHLWGFLPHLTPHMAVYGKPHR